jgi:hypothetical protein
MHIVYLIPPVLLTCSLAVRPADATYKGTYKDTYKDTYKGTYKDTQRAAAVPRVSLTCSLVCAMMKQQATECVLLL